MIESPITRPLAALLLMLSVALAAGCSGAASRPVGAPTGGRSAGERADRPTSAGSVAHLEERALLLLLADRRTYEPLVVRRSLAGPPDLREDLAVALGRAGDPRGLDPLLGLLLDDAPAVRRAAAFALGELGERLPEARIEARRRAAAALLDAASAPDREVGVLAVEALGKLAVTLGTVSGRLDELPAEERAARLLPSLHRYPDPRMPDVAARALASGDPELRRWAVYALARHPMPESLPTLRALAREVAAVLEEDAGGGDARIAVWVARGLAAAGGASGGEAGGEAARDLELLRPFLDWPGRSPSDGADPVIAALRAARTLIGDGRAAAPADWRDRLAELLDDPRPGVRLTAVDAASVWLLDPRLGDLLAARASGGASAAEHAAALLALATGGDPRAEELATAAAVSPRERVRAAAARAAGILGAEVLLGRLGGDPAPRVREAVFAARVALAGEGSVADVVRRALRDPDSGVRAAALTWLAARPVLELDALGEALRTALARGGRGTAAALIEERLAAVDALVARAARPAAGSAGREAAIAFLLDLATESGYAVRSRAAEGLARLGAERPAVGPVGTGRGVAVYRRIVLETRRPRTVEIRTERGAVRVRLACPTAPLTCVNFLRLAGQGFYDGLTFHRLTPGLVIQGGDPRGDGWGDPGYAVRDEIGRLRFGRGVLAMALAGSAGSAGSTRGGPAPDSAGSRFFLTLAPQPRLDGAYTAFGTVVSGMDVLEELLPGDRIEEIRALDPAG